jgi:hypothetical protein
MSKGFEKMIKRQVVMADGRYLIFYTFAPCDRPGSSNRADPIPETEGATPIEENLSV